MFLAAFFSLLDIYTIQLTQPNPTILGLNQDTISKYLRSDLACDLFIHLSSVYLCCGYRYPILIIQGGSEVCFLIPLSVILLGIIFIIPCVDSAFFSSQF